MADQSADQDQQRGVRSRIALLLWIGLLAGCIWQAVDPMGSRVSRLSLALAIPLLWAGAIFFLRRRRIFAIALGAVALLVGLFLCLPGRGTDPTRLRGVYLAHLRRYEGTRYVWGGEGRLGIDCSGLVRRAMIEAELELGVRTLNPGLIRAGFSLWWHDCTAKELRDGFRGLTRQAFPAAALNDIAGDARLQPGDLAVTANGAHVLAYLGNASWIEADPDFMKVVRLSAPSESGWFRTPVLVVRWTCLEPER